ncbi:MAG TPA: nucleotidyltransferase family protein [bacterium]|nr:nucleotidyltransferase family protein [bacterium]HPN43243.1 nucleotidyltransferase family protein [bacterium]
MKALILAAGIGSRLAPLTDTLPKALVQIGGKTLLQIVLDRLSYWKFDEIIINIFHHADQVKRFIEKYAEQNPKITIKISREEHLLDTGGGIKKMLNFLRSDEPVLVHNVDIISGIDLQEFYQNHCRSGATTSLAVQKRPSSRPLLFDETLHLCGRLHPKTGNYTIVTKPTGHVSEFSFCGIQIIDPKLFLTYPADKFYSIDVYLKAAAAGQLIRGHVCDNIYWKDVGTVQAIQQVEADIERGITSI